MFLCIYQEVSEEPFRSHKMFEVLFLRVFVWGDSFKEVLERFFFEAYCI